jgi:hypothetical protein
MFLAFAGYSSSPPSRAKPSRVPEISAGWGAVFQRSPTGGLSLFWRSATAPHAEQLLICFGPQRALCAIITSFFLWRRERSGGTLAEQIKRETGGDSETFTDTCITGYCGFFCSIYGDDRGQLSLVIPPREVDEESMKIGYIFPAVVGVAGIALLIWFIASGAWMPGH